MYRVAVPFYDSHGGVWLPTGKVVTHFDGKRWEYFHTYNSGFPDDNAGTIRFAPDHSVWIATDYSGIAVYTPDGSASTDHDKATVGIAQNISVVPNPVTNDVFTLSIPIERGCRVHVSLVDPLGHTVKSVADVVQPAGIYSTHVNAMNLAAGLYFVRIELGDVITSLPVMVAR